MISQLLTSRNVQIIVLIMLLSFSVGIMLIDPPFIERLRQHSFDTYNRLLPRKSENDVVIIGIDTASIKKMDKGPLRRNIMTAMVANLHDMGAKVIAFDRIFEFREVRDAASQMPGVPKEESDKDFYFAHDVANAGNVVLCFAMADHGYDGEGGRDPVLKGRIAYKGGDAAQLNPHFFSSQYYQTALPSLTEVAAGYGFANFVPEEDAILRRFPMMMTQTNGKGAITGVFPALSLDTVRVALGGDAAFEVVGSPGRGIERVNLGPYSVPTDRNGVARVYYAGRNGRLPYIPYWELITGKVDPARIKGKIALIGTMSPNMGDVRSSPIDPFMQGVEAHAEMIEQILHGQYLSRPRAMPAVEAAATFFFSIAVIFLAQEMNALLLAGVVACFAGGAVLGGLAAFGHFGWLIDPLCPSAVTIVIFMLASILSALRTAIVSHEKSKFLALMSHEIRTPMTGILGIIEFLKDDGLAEEERKSFVNTISECSKTLLNTLNDILDVSKLEEGKLEVSNINCDLHAVLRNCANILDRMAGNKGLTIKVEIEDGVPQHIYGDPYRLQQIVMNFMNNAIKFTSKGGVTVHCSCRKASPAPIIRVEIRDTGIGISEKNIKKLFRGFSQADSSIARKFGGTGLGLSIAKDLVQLMGGTVGVSSVLGTGSTFWFEIPYQPPGAAAAEEEEAAEAPPMDILLAEDNKVTQQVAMRLLGNKGHKVTLVDDGETVVKMAQERDFDMILMDMNMPVKSGLDATRDIRALGGKYKDLPIIALTANVVDEYVQKCYKAGMNAHVAKPFSPRELYQTMARLAPESARARRPIAAAAPAAFDPSLEKLTPNLREIAAQLGVAYVNDYIKNSLREADRLLASARAAQEKGDHAALSGAAHDLKNVGGMIGLAETGRLSAVIETLCRKNELTALPDMMQALIREARREIRAMERERGLSS